VGPSVGGGAETGSELHPTTRKSAKAEVNALRKIIPSSLCGTFRLGLRMERGADLTPVVPIGDRSVMCFISTVVLRERAV
jgi:hypothetical protein